MTAIAQDIEGFARALRRGEVTSEQAVRRYLERIAERPSALGVFRHIRASEALAEARALDAELLRGHDRGSLMGVPIAIKEIMALKGVGCSVNSALDVTDLLPDEGAFVRALRAAGCVILGTTTSTEFALATLNWNGTGPHNPVDPNTPRLCGGSSHGSAVAVAAGLCAFAVGTDTGGSVRVPAALCGVAGYKSTRGVWPIDGVFPAAPSFDSLGVFAASAADCSVIAHVLGPALRAPAVSASGLRLGVLQERGGEPPDATVQDALDQAIDRMRRAGASVSPVDAVSANEVAYVFSRLMPAEFARGLGIERLRVGLGRMDPVTAARAGPELDMNAGEFDALQGQIAQWRRAVDAQMAGFDAWVCATTPMVATARSALRTLDDALQWNRRVGRYTRPVNVFDQCAISIPLPTRVGLPAGLQIIGRHRDDARLLAIASVIEACLRLG